MKKRVGVHGRYSTAIGNLNIRTGTEISTVEANSYRFEGKLEEVSVVVAGSYGGPE